MKNVIVCCFLCLLLLGRSCSAQDKRTLPPNFSRSDFVARRAKVKGGMTHEQVTALLGPPDIVINQVDFPYYFDLEYWLYGVTPKSGCPTLGDVAFADKKVVGSDDDKDDKNDENAEPPPPPESLISEAKLRELLDLFYSLHNAPYEYTDGYTFDPLTCIKAVNILQPYGKERVLAAVEEYHRVFGFGRLDDRLLTVLRVLFDTPDNRSFVLRESWGETRPPAPLNTNMVPRFPILLLDDVPFFLIYLGSWEHDQGTYTEPSPNFLEDLKKNGQIRKTPLRPPSDPLPLFDKLLASDQWLCGKKYPAKGYDNIEDYTKDHPNDETIGRQIAMLQLLRLVRSAIPASNPYHAYLRYDRDHLLVPTEWPRIRAELSRHSIHWNPKINEYQAN